ncbi:MAG: SUMF1/EgtB/PvdO family nonheme iron enzyme [Magnetococcales bacterium]|nr:SUMF1/EgtB/PvdO family nonheme iron enzyme [Magnetococcales bacterium]
MSSKIFNDALPPGSKLLWFEIIKVLGKGGFGITYLGKDTKQDKFVAIKEYLPTAFASRTEDMEVRPNSPGDAKTFEWGLVRFLKEAQILARFKHSSIVRVVSFFRDSSTAYMVMEYIEGNGLDYVLKKRKTLSEDYIKQILPPLLDGLQMMHSANFIHRDIKPPNIMIRKDGRPVLLDFGSARQSVAGQGVEMTSLLSIGYSPFEQYDSSGDRQGAWSDIYALSGVLYRAITGKKPPDASQRIAARLRSDPDPMLSAVEMGAGRYDESFLKAIDHALMVLETERPQSIAEWRVELFGAVKDLKPAPASKSAYTSAGSKVGTPKKRKKSSWRSFIASVSELGGNQENRESITAICKDGITPVKGDVKRKVSVAADKNPQSEPTPVLVVSKPEKEQTLKADGNWIEQKTKMEFIWVPAGKFMMGSREKEPGHKPSEGPVHEVELDGFWFGKYPVTWEQWRQVMGNYPSGLFDPVKAKHPVERVSFSAINKFLSRFSNIGDGENIYRLPTEAEWEYSVRCGTNNLFHFKGGSKELATYAWYKTNSEGGTHPVGEKQPNKWGFHDLMGNVWEWVSDWYGQDFYKISPAKNPVGKMDESKKRALRGGSWASPPKECRSANRQGVSEKIKNSMIGFRVVRVKRR